MSQKKPIITKSKALTPPLKWAGGKRWLVPHLLPIWQKHQHRRLVEPFSGGLAVTLGLLPTEALLNDINPFLINFYTQVKKGLKIKRSLVNSQAEYTRARDEFNKIMQKKNPGVRDQKRQAELFYYINRTCFNGLCRFNSKGEYNVPWGGRDSKGLAKTINYVTDFKDWTKAFAHWDFSIGDFEKLDIQANDFLYLDPPYDTPFTKYAKEDFGWEDQKRLVEWAKRWADQGLPVVLSNEATERIVALYAQAGFTLTMLDAPRRIAANGNRAKAKEVLATRNI